MMSIFSVLVQFAIATLCLYFACFAVPSCFYRKGREETEKKREEMQGLIQQTGPTRIFSDVFHLMWLPALILTQKLATV